jgi:hypothetical protein
MQQAILEAFANEVLGQLASQTSIAEKTDALTEGELEQRLLAFQLLGVELVIAVLEELPSAQQAELLQAMNPFELVRVLEALKPESRHALFANLSLEVVEPLIAQLNELSPLLIPSLFGGCQLGHTVYCDRPDYSDRAKKYSKKMISCCLNTIIQTSKNLNVESFCH